MPHCPQCQHPLPAPRANRRQACSLCGWVEPPPEQPQRADAKAQEIARERALNATPVWKYAGIVLGALTVLVLISNSLSQGFVSVVKRDEPSASVSPESAFPSSELSASPEPSPVVSNVPVTVPTPEQTPVSEASASPSATSEASASASPLASPSGSASPLDPAALEAEAREQAVASSVNALEAPPDPAVSASAALQVQPPALPSNPSR